MTIEEWFALGALLLSIIGSAFALYARLVRVETALKPLVDWFYSKGPLAWEEAHLHAIRSGAQAAVLEIIAQDRRLRATPAEKQAAYAESAGEQDE